MAPSFRRWSSYGHVLRARPRVWVKLIEGTEERDGKWVHGIYDFVQNPSSTPVHIANISVLYPYRKPTVGERLKHVIEFRRLPRRMGWVHTSLHYYDIPDGCPVTIEPGKAHKVLITRDIVDKLLEDCVRRELIASTQDQLWNDTYSSPMKVRVFKK